MHAHTRDHCTCTPTKLTLHYTDNQRRNGTDGASNVASYGGHVMNSCREAS